MFDSSPLAIAFDLDGTLVDSVTDLTTACNLARADMGLGPLEESVVRGYVGDGARKLVQRSLGGDEAQVDKGLRRFRAHYRAHLLDSTEAYPGVVETLERMAHLPKAVVTNKPHDMAVSILEGLGLAEHFGSVVGARGGVPVKPAPDMLQLAFDQLGVDPARGWMVGDSPNDVLVARAVGARAIAVSYGIGKIEEIEAAGPDVMLDEFTALSGLLNQKA